MSGQERGGIRWLMGETLIIVLGVLIALGLNDWWTNRLERAEEREYLERFHASVLRDQAWLTQRDSLPHERKLDALNAIAPVVRGQAPVPEDRLTFFKNVSRGAIFGIHPTDWVDRSTLEDIQSVGKLALIRDAELRRAITRYYRLFLSMQNAILSRRTGYAQDVHQWIPAELRDEITLEDIDAFGTEQALAHFTSPQFALLMNQEYNYALYIGSRHLRFQQLSEELQEKLEQYLAQMD